MEIAGDPDRQTGTNGERAKVFWKEKLQALVEPTLLGRCYERGVQPTFREGARCRRARAGSNASKR